MVAIPDDTREALRDFLADQLVDQSDIAALAGVRLETVRQWRWRQVFTLEPFIQKSTGPLWLKADVLTHLKEIGRGSEE